MTTFFIPGDCSDQAYRNVRDATHPRTKRGRVFTERLWKRYEPFADKHFRRDAQAHFIQRFWEMYLCVALTERGFDLAPGTGKGPECSFRSGERRVWLEAIAPGPGTGADQVPEPELGVAYDVPTEKVLLRFASAVADKRRRYLSALSSGLIKADDGYVLAINSRLIPHGPYGNTLPFYVQALLPIGNLTLRLNQTTHEVVDRFYEAREEVPKQNGSAVSMQPFLDPTFAFLSAVIHSSVDCVNRPRRFGGDFSVLHNPMAAHPLDPQTLGWCEQYVFRDNELTKLPAGRHCPRRGALPKTRSSLRKARGAARG